MVIVICLIIGLVTAFIGDLMGLGGDIILIPSMLFMSSISKAFSWATPQAIVGISLITMIFTAISSTITYCKKGRVDYKTGLLFLTGSIPGGIIGSWLNQFVDSEAFLFYFGILTILISMLFLSNENSLREIWLEKIKTYGHFIWMGKPINIPFRFG